jgi:hypothetical protein
VITDCLVRTKGASLVVGPLVTLALVFALATVPTTAQDKKLQLSVEVAAGPRIDRNIFGLVAEHLGHGV